MRILNQIFQFQIVLILVQWKIILMQVVMQITIVIMNENNNKLIKNKTKKITQCMKSGAFNCELESIIP